MVDRWCEQTMLCVVSWPLEARMNGAVTHPRLTEATTGQVNKRVEVADGARVKLPTAYEATSLLLRSGLRFLDEVQR